MTGELPSLEVHPPDCFCPVCMAALELRGMCGLCGWDEERDHGREMDELSRRISAAQVQS